MLNNQHQQKLRRNKKAKVFFDFSLVRKIELHFPIKRKPQS